LRLLRDGREHECADHETAVTGFIAAYLDGVKYLESSPQAWITVGKTLDLEEPVAGQIRDRSKWGRFPTVWNEQVIEDQIKLLEFIQKYAPKEFLPTLDRSAFTTKYVPKTA
jgi:hypothetical protein